MREPLDHVTRSPLPWRDGPELTECGRPLAKCQVISLDEFLARVRDLGQQRAAYTTCMTCWDTAARWLPKDSPDLIEPVAREAHAAGYTQHDETRVRLYRELQAIQALIANHREEWAELLGGYAAVTPLPVRQPRRRRQR